MAKKPVLLCIMDGFGWVPNETFGNAVVAAKTPHLDALMEKYPMTTIDASGMAVGLPDGQMGNSEVGHTNMGAGRIVYQQLTLITKSIHDGEMLKNPVLVKNMKAAIEAGKAIHLMGLVGTGGVHSHADHWFGVLEMAKHLGAKEVYLHCITDGRDTDPHSGKGFLADLQAKLDELGVGKIASVSGRYYAMDRDNNWDREEKAYAAFVYGEGEHAANAAEAIEASYAADKTDEFVLPLYYGCTGSDGSFTLSNITAMADSVHYKAFWNSVWIALASTLICLVISYPLAYILSKGKHRGSGIVIMLFILPMWINFLLRVLALQVILSKTGILNAILGFFGLPLQKLMYTKGAVLVGMVYDYIPFMILPIYNALCKIDKDVIEAAHDLGASARVTFQKIIIPLSLPGVISGIIMVFIPSISEFVVADILGGSKVLLFGNVIDQEFNVANNWNLGSGLSIVLMIFIFISMAIMNRHASEEGDNMLW